MTWSFHNHTHKNYSDITYVRRGIVKQNVNGAEFDYPEGTLLWTREDDTHDVRGDNFCYLNITIGQDRLVELMTVTGESQRFKQLLKGPVSPSVTLDQRQRELFEGEMETLFFLQGTTRGNLKVHGLILSAFADYFFAGVEEAASDPPPLWFDQALRWIEEHLEDGITTAALPRAAGRTAEHVSRSFVRFLGVTPSHYINERRLTRAALLLSNTNMEILDICYSLGFNSPSYFYRLFTGRYSLPPRAYRAKNQTYL